MQFISTVHDYLFICNCSLLFEACTKVILKVNKLSKTVSSRTYHIELIIKFKLSLIKIYRIL